MALNSFITHIKTVGVPLASQFSVTVPVIDGAVNSKAETVSFICHGATLPGHNLMTNEIRIYGEPLERPYGVSYSPVSLTFYLDNDLSALRYFNAWSDMVLNRKSRELGYYDAYTKEVEISVLDRQGKAIETYKLYEAYPKTINDIPFEYASRNTSSVVVQLVYKWWEVTKENKKIVDRNQEVPTNAFPEYGFDSLDQGTEGLGSQTGVTLPGQGSPMSPALPGFGGVDTQLLNAGQQIISDSTRSLNQAGNMFDMSSVVAPGNNAVGADLVGLTGSLSGGFNDFGRSISQLGDTNSLQTMLPQMRGSIDNIALDSGRLSSIVSSLGGDMNINSDIAELMRNSNNLQTAASTDDLLPYLTSSSSAFSNIGSSIERSIPQMTASTPSFDRMANNGFSSISSVFNSNGSILSQSLTSLRK
jgi:hypothetical protein